MRDAYRRSFSTLSADFGDSSPEFFSEDEEDYSVYLVDPVETQQSGSTLNNASSSNGVLPQFTGVTVGLGVLSSLLDSSAEEVWVSGTISTGPDGSESLEVVFTLKPVCELLWRGGTVELIMYGLRGVDEEETSTSCFAEETVQETTFSIATSASHQLPFVILPAIGKVVFLDRSRDQSSQCQVLQV